MKDSFIKFMVVAILMFLLFAGLYIAYMYKVAGLV